MRAAAAGLPLVDSEDELKQGFKIRNKTIGRRPLAAEQNQNLPKIEKPKVEGAMGLPLVGNDEYLKKELKILNPLGRGDRRAKSENQNLPKMENRKAEAAAGLPMVGTECSHIHRKETRRTTRPATRFHDHLVLESKPHLMIILQLENAPAASHSTTHV